MGLFEVIGTTRTGQYAVVVEARDASDALRRARPQVLKMRTFQYQPIVNWAIIPVDQ